MISYFCVRLHHTLHHRYWFIHCNVFYICVVSCHIVLRSYFTLSVSDMLLLWWGLRCIWHVRHLCFFWYLCTTSVIIKYRWQSTISIYFVHVHIMCGNIWICTLTQIHQSILQRKIHQQKKICLDYNSIKINNLSDTFNIYVSQNFIYYTINTVFTIKINNFLPKKVMKSKTCLWLFKLLFHHTNI